MQVQVEGLKYACVYHVHNVYYYELCKLGSMIKLIMKGSKWHSHSFDLTVCRYTK